MKKKSNSYLRGLVGLLIFVLVLGSNPALLAFAEDGADAAQGQTQVVQQEQQEQPAGTTVQESTGEGAVSEPGAVNQNQTATDGNEQQATGTESQEPAPASQSAEPAPAAAPLGAPLAAPATSPVFNETKATGHDSLAEAVAQASSGDVIVVNENLSGAGPFTIDKSLTIDFQGHTITPALSSMSGSFISINRGISVVLKNGTFQGSDNGRAIRNSGTLKLVGMTIRDFASSSGGGAVRSEYDTDTTIQGSTFSGNRSEDKDIYYGGGGALYIGTFAKYLVEETLFDGNSATNFGGAISANQGAAGTIRDSVISNNETGINGGGIRIHFGGETVLENNTIVGNRVFYDNTVTYDDPLRDEYDRIAHGGGVYIRAHHQVSGGGVVTLRNNDILNNSASSNENNVYYGRGGGLSMDNYGYAADGSNFINLESGRFIGNTARNGGAIDYMGIQNSPLVLLNALITENSATRGGGVWLCPVGSLQEHTNLGGTIVNNLAKLNPAFTNGSMGTMVSSNNLLYAEGDDVVNEGIGSRDLRNFYSESRMRPVSVQSRGLGGVQSTWYRDYVDYKGLARPGYDDIDNYRYAVMLAEYEKYQADPEAYLADSANAGKGIPTGPLLADMEALEKGARETFYLHAVADLDTVEQLKQEAAILIMDNHATERGGGIAANSPIILGSDEYPEKELTVTKQWRDEDDQALTEYDGLAACVNLVRVDEEGNRVTLDRDIELNKSNNWTVTFAGLPSVYRDSEGTIRNYAYTVEEMPMVDWQGEVVQAAFDYEALSYTATVINRPRGDKPKELPVTPPIEAKKLLNGQNPGNATFTFELYDMNEGKNELIATAQNKGETIRFECEELTFTEVGDYYYKIVERNDGAPGIIYDTKEIEVVISVTSDGQGGLTSSVAYYGQLDGGLPVFNNQLVPPDEPKGDEDKPPTPPKDKAPKTGDAGEPVLALGIMGWALLIALFTGRKKRAIK